jgi:heme-degrading monooxygenase HmoA
MAASPNPPGAKIARVWRGRTAREKADEYQEYWLENGIEPLLKRGALGVQMLREDRGHETEFVTISYWESVDHMTGPSGRGSGGANPRSTHHLPRDPEFLIELPRTVQILEILEIRGKETAEGR